MKRSNRTLGKAVRLFLYVFLFGSMSQPVFAIEVEGNITLASNYIWRGLDQNNGNPAVQGGFDLNFENGLYGGIWGSNVADVEGANNIEVDIYAGYTRRFGDYGLDMAYIRYEYPKRDPDFEELMLQASYKGLGIAYYYRLGTQRVGESENYVRVKAEVNLPAAVGMTLAAGQSSIKGMDEINDALIGFHKHAGGVKLGLAVTTSNFDHVTGSNVKTDFLTVSISKAL